MLYRGAFSAGNPSGGRFFNPLDLRIKSIANTNVVHWGGRIFALHEVRMRCITQVAIFEWSNTSQDTCSYFVSCICISMVVAGPAASFLRRKCLAVLHGTTLLLHFLSIVKLSCMEGFSPGGRRRQGK